MSANKVSTVALPDWLPCEAWAAFVEMRNRIRKPLTDYAMKLAIAKLDRLRQAGEDVREVLDQSTLADYQGLWKIKDKPPINVQAKPPEKPWWEDDMAVALKAKDLGIKSDRRETCASLKAKVFITVGDGPWFSKLDGLIARYIEDLRVAGWRKP